ncbi:hypothetical protein [Bdellovibrio sp. KM01]|uniref:hypothetical protein n=1 Tax=Bdellovibrio sp. KM01 TaxID=2748865 RepID=UPI0015E99DE6|nr:hypothetical protein [Bdellovibrio sp. KM01]QLY25835.1 hypothetical protein HW988_01965 [Bdellovibrio sp. KM01]
MKKAIRIAMSVVMLAAAAPQFATAQNMTIQQAITQKRLENAKVREQLNNLKIQLADMRTELDKEQSRFGYQASKWTRNISIATAGVASVMTVINYKTETNKNFFLYGLIAAASGLTAGLAQIGVALTNDQVVELEAKISDLNARIEAAEATLTVR